MQPAADDADEVLVARQLLIEDSGELERALGEIAGRRPQAERSRAFSVALLAVTGAAILQVRDPAGVERVGGDRLARQLHRLLERRGLLAAGGEDQQGEGGTVH